MKRIILICAAVLLTSCGAKQTENTSAVTESDVSAETTLSSETQPVASEESTVSQHETVKAETVGYEGMTPVYGADLKDGVYSISVDSSSSMFKINECELTVSGGQMTAVMTMSGTGYKYLFMGTEDEAAAAAEDTFIPCDESGEAHRFTVPVEALDMEIDCAAFSRKKEEWYGRKLVFRADSLPDEAFADGTFDTAESLGIADGEYNIAVTLEGGSGRASVQSPALLTVKDGNAEAEIIWSSNKYDYMLVDGEKLLPVSNEEYSVFVIPVTRFNGKMSVAADTTAMSTPHEIEYTLYFDSSSLESR